MQKTSEAKKIAVFGGKFDPPHLAHQLIIFLCLEKYGMDEVWIVPSYSHAFGFTPSDFDLRVEMCSFLQGSMSERVSILEDEKEIDKEPVYTIDLMKHLLERYGNHDYHLIIGEDNWNARDKWKDFETLEKMTKPIVIGRNGSFDNFFPMADISSSLIREMISEGKEVSHLLPAGLADFIKSRSLYSA